MGVAGCYNDFDMPVPRPAATDADFADMERISIADVKQLFLTEHGSISGTGENSDWEHTKYTLIGQSESGKDYYIKGKVQSSDEEGNIYKSLHLVDETGAIEVKLSTGLYIDYPMGTYDKATGTIPTHWVYVKVTGLYVGNYRMMLSIGSRPHRLLQQGRRAQVLRQLEHREPHGDRPARLPGRGDRAEARRGDPRDRRVELRRLFRRGRPAVSGPSGADQGRHVPLRGGRFEPLSVVDVHRPASRGVEVLVQVGGQ